MSDNIDEEAKRLGEKYPEFWDDVHRNDNSGYIQGEDTSGGWGAWCNNKYYEYLQEVIEIYHEREKAEAEAEKKDN